jgi:hypothetical protein
MMPSDLIDALTLAAPALAAGFAVGAAGYWLVVARLDLRRRRRSPARGAAPRDWS